MKKKLGPKPNWIGHGIRVDYHQIIGGPITQKGLLVQQGPQLVCGQWVVWLAELIGHVSVDACTLPQD
jgi:hypothetical protein